jgi:hypothetical protein
MYWSKLLRFPTWFEKHYDLKHEWSDLKYTPYSFGFPFRSCKHCEITVIWNDKLNNTGKTLDTYLTEDCPKR